MTVKVKIYGNLFTSLELDCPEHMALLLEGTTTYMHYQEKEKPMGAWGKLGEPEIAPESLFSKDAIIGYPFIPCDYTGETTKAV